VKEFCKETIIKISKYENDYFIPEDSDNFDNFNSISNKTLSYIQDIAFYATTIAHYDGNVPITILEIDDISLSSITNLMIFFMFSCGISGYMLKINPFDQPGVEDYKSYRRFFFLFLYSMQNLYIEFMIFQLLLKNM